MGSRRRGSGRRRGERVNILLIKAALCFAMEKSSVPKDFTTLPESGSDVK